MIQNIALALTVAAISTGAAAQSNRKQPTWDDLLKPLDVKTNPAIPVAPPQSYQPSPADSPLVNGCVFEAIGRLPFVEGARVASSKAKFNRPEYGYASRVELWDIFVSVDFNGRPVHYQFYCRVSPDVGRAELKNH
jgi:hypothetical protein